MGRNKFRNRQKVRTSIRLKLIIGASVFMTASVVMLAVFYMGEIKDSNANSFGDYRTIESGNWDDATVWETYDGDAWVPASMPPLHNNNKITIASGQHVNLEEELLFTQLIIEKNAKLDIHCNVIKLVKKSGEGGLICDGEISLGEVVIEGDGDVTINAEATMKIGSGAGIDKKGKSGNIQTKGKLVFSKDATYIFDGTIKQRTGNGLPLSMNILVIDNTSGVELDFNLSIIKKLSLLKGVLFTSRYAITLGASLNSPAAFEFDKGAVCGNIKCWYGDENFEHLIFPLSDGYNTTMFRFISDVINYRKGMLDLIFKNGLPDDSKKSPYEARQVVVGISGHGFYSASMSHNAEEAWLRAVPPSNNSKQIVWNISSGNSKLRVQDSTFTTIANPGNFSNLITGPQPFGNFLVVRFHSQNSGISHLSLVGHGGKVVKNEKITCISGYNQVIFNLNDDLPSGDYLLQLSSISEIKTAKVTRKKTSDGPS